VLFKEKSGEESAAQIMSFEASVAPLYERRRRRSQTGATAGGGLESEAVYKEIVTSGPGPGLAQTLRVCGL